jgi:hypothetical protein
LSPGRNQAVLAEKDELLHRPTEEPKWRESYYFNWVDLRNRISGFSTIGILPNEGKREFVFALFIGDQVEVYYQEPKLERMSNHIINVLRDNRLAYRMVSPLNEWEITYTSRKLRFDLIFKTRFATYNFAKDSSASWQHHFEASGTITGKIQYIGGDIKNIRGYGQRDKSWGHRDWHQFDHWFAAQFQFKKWSCAFRKDYPGNRIDLSGYIASSAGTNPLIEMEIETVNDTDRFKTPLTSTFTFADPAGNRHTVQSERIGKNAYFRFARPFPEGYTELFEQMVIMKDKDTGEIGSGMVEYLRTYRNATQEK